MQQDLRDLKTVSDPSYTLENSFILLCCLQLMSTTNLKVLFKHGINESVTYFIYTSLEQFH